MKFYRTKKADKQFFAYSKFGPDARTEPVGPSPVQGADARPQRLLSCARLATEPPRVDMLPSWLFGRVGRVAVMDGSTAARTLAREVAWVGACAWARGAFNTMASSRVQPDHLELLG